MVQDFDIDRVRPYNGLMRMIRRMTFLTFFLCMSAALGGESITNLQAGYHDGFYLRSEDDRFLIKLGGRVDFGFQYGFLDTSSDYASFDLIHAKIFMGGNLFSPDFQFYVQTAAGSNDRPLGSYPVVESTRGGWVLEDYFVQWRHGIWGVRAGQFKVPFGRQWMIYSGNLQFTDRSIATRRFLLGRDRGVLGSLERERWEWSVGAFNGGGLPSQGGGLNAQPIGTNGQNASNDPGKKLLYVTRLTYTPLGKPSLSEGDVERSEGHRLQFAASFAFDHGRDVDPNGDKIAEDTDANVYNAQGEATWKHHGTSFASEYFYRLMKGDTAGKLPSMGGYFQAGTFVTSGLEIAGRFSFLDPNIDLSDDLIFEASGALNLYFSSDHRYKVQGQYTWRNTEQAIGSSAQDHFADLLFQWTI